MKNHPATLLLFTAAAALTFESANAAPGDQEILPAKSTTGAVALIQGYWAPDPTAIDEILRERKENWRPKITLPPEKIAKMVRRWRLNAENSLFRIDSDRIHHVAIGGGAAYPYKVKSGDGSTGELEFELVVGGQKRVAIADVSAGGRLTIADIQIKNRQVLVRISKTEFERRRQEILKMKWVLE